MAKLQGEGSNAQYSMSLGGMFYDAWLNEALDEIPGIDEPIKQKLLNTCRQVWTQDPAPGWMHSSFCSMSLPVQEPDDPAAPIVKRNGGVSLIIQPLQTQQVVDGELQQVCFGMPYGKFARLILYYLMTQAKLQKTRHIVLGRSFSDWLRKMNFSSVGSGGKRGTRTLFMEQLRRIMSCQWTFRVDSELAEKGKRPSKQPGDVSAFAVEEMKVTNKFAGLKGEGGEFVSHFVLTEEFYEQLQRRSVPLNDHAIAAVSKSPLQMDLYCWMAARLHRIPKGEAVRVSWSEFIDQFGTGASSTARAKQSIRDAWNVVGGVYPQARNSVDFGVRWITLMHAEGPREGNLLLVGRDQAANASSATKAEQLSLRGFQPKSPSVDPQLTFPKGSLEYENELWKNIARQQAPGMCKDFLAREFREMVGAEIRELSGKRLVSRWQGFCAHRKANN